MGIAGITSGMDRYSGLFGAMATETNRRAPRNLLEATTTESTAGDVLDISAEAEAALQKAQPLPQNLPGLLLQSLFGDAGADGNVTIWEMEEMHEKTLGAVQGKLHDLFSKHKIDTSKEIRLQVAGDGRVIVANDHPQKAEIEKLFADDPALRNEFVKLTSLTEMVGAAREAAAFQKAYADDPYAAVAQYAYLFNATQKAQVSISIVDDKFESLYERLGVETQSIGGE